MESTKQRVKDIGMNDYLAKPVHKDRLYLKMAVLLEGVEKVMD
jgi:DNA-binding response OmpR family regulator